LAIDANSVQALVANGVVALLRKDYAAAEGAFEKAHLLEPENTAITNNLALALVEQDGDAKKIRAQKYAQINRRLAPQDAEVLSTFGWVAYKSGQVDAAEQALSQAVQSPGVGPDTLYYRARVATDKKDLATAKRFLAAALAAKGSFSKRQEAEQLLKDLK
jgi:Tfp pilus assembly protein PilF